MRAANGIQLLNLIRESGPVSRATLAKLSGLSKPTISEQVKSLISRGVVVELGTGEATKAGGKKPTMVDFKVDAGRAIAVSIDADKTRLRCTDLRGRITEEDSIDTKPQAGSSAFLHRLNRAVAAMMSRAQAPVRVVAVGTPGRVDCNRGVILETDNVFGWKNVDVRSAIDAPVLIDNDVKLALIAEVHHGRAKGLKTAVLLRLGVGIGSAVAIDGAVHHGAHWAAGEVSLLAPAPVRRPNPRGYLEAVLGSDQIARRVRAAGRRSPALRSAIKQQPELAALFSVRRDREAARIVQDLASHLHLAVASQALAFDPDVVLVSGELFDYMLDDVRKLVARSISWPVLIEKAALGDDAVLAGATHLALSRTFDQMSEQLQARVAGAYA
jgi:predicted NBD/HSP70 family sugar kinase